MLSWLQQSFRLLPGPTLAVALATLVFSNGCYLDYPEHAGSAEVQGVVTLDGRPVNNANVVFLPMRLRNPSAQQPTPVAFGITNGDGEFQLHHHPEKQEIVASTYHVIITKRVVMKDSEGRTLNRWPMDILPDSVRDVESLQYADEKIPAIYNRDSILTFEVKPSPKILRPEFKLTSLDPQLTAPD